MGRRSLSVAEAAAVLAAGGVVVFPTETVYGLGADARSETAVQRIFRIKGRPADNPLIVHIASVHELVDVAALVPEHALLRRNALQLLNAFAPGPLTLVLPVGREIPRIVTAGLDTVAVRIPQHPIALELISRSGCPVAAPSANRSGSPSPTTVETARSSLGDGSADGADGDGARAVERADGYVDGGPCAVGLESTVVRVRADLLEILRPGAVTESAMADVTGLPVIGPGVPGGTDLRTGGVSSDVAAAAPSPGMRHRHYQPEAEVVLFSDPLRVARWLGRTELDRAGIAVLALAGGTELAALEESSRRASAVLRRFDSLEAYARGLYAAFYEMDRLGVRTILAQLPEPVGLGAALVDRLARASGGRRI